MAGSILELGSDGAFDLDEAEVVDLDATVASAATKSRRKPATATATATDSSNSSNSSSSPGGATTPARKPRTSGGDDGVEFDSASRSPSREAASGSIARARAAAAAAGNKLNLSPTSSSEDVTTSGGPDSPAPAAAAATAAPTISKEDAAKITYVKGEVVEWWDKGRPAAGEGEADSPPQWRDATVREVSYDDLLVPYYTITIPSLLDEERSTVPKRLRKKEGEAEAGSAEVDWAWKKVIRL